MYLRKNSRVQKDDLCLHVQSKHGAESCSTATGGALQSASPRRYRRSRAENRAFRRVFVWCHIPPILHVFLIPLVDCTRLQDSSAKSSDLLWPVVLYLSDLSYWTNITLFYGGMSATGDGRRQITFAVPALLNSNQHHHPLAMTEKIFSRSPPSLSGLTRCYRLMGCPGPSARTSPSCAGGNTLLPILCFSSWNGKWQQQRALLICNLCMYHYQYLGEGHLCPKIAGSDATYRE